MYRDIFEEFFQPHLTKAVAYLHDHGKFVAFHSDADAKLLLEPIAEIGYDMAECFCCAPMVSCTLEEARETWGTRVKIWGGIPSTLLEDSTSDADFEEYMKNLFRTIAPGDGFALGISDKVMPTAKFDRLVRISEMVRDWGKCPVDPEEDEQKQPSL